MVAKPIAITRSRSTLKLLASLEITRLWHANVNSGQVWDKRDVFSSQHLPFNFTSPQVSSFPYLHLFTEVTLQGETEAGGEIAAGWPHDLGLLPLYTKQWRRGHRGLDRTRRKGPTTLITEVSPVPGPCTRPEVGPQPWVAVPLCPNGAESQGSWEAGFLPAGTGFCSHGEHSSLGGKGQTP